MATQQLNAKLVICSVPTKNSAASQKFYNALFGGDDFARSANELESYYRPISQDGVTLTVTARQNDKEPITVYFAVDNLDQTVKALEAAGGKQIVNSTPMHISGKPEALKAIGVAAQSTAGQFATMQDPDGNYLGLMQLESHVQALLGAQPEHRKLSPTQVSSIDTLKKAL